MLERLFKLREYNTTIRRELMAGLTTFVSMAYIVVVNPRILSEAGMPLEGVLFATWWARSCANRSLMSAGKSSARRSLPFSLYCGRAADLQRSHGLEPGPFGVHAG